MRQQLLKVHLARWLAATLVLATACGEASEPLDSHACPFDGDACAWLVGQVHSPLGSAPNEARLWIRDPDPVRGLFEFRPSSPGIDTLGHFEVTVVRVAAPDPLPEPDTLTLRCGATDIFDHDLQDSVDVVAEFAPAGTVPPVTLVELILRHPG
ncbi:MAG: hypothetical protein GTO22_11695 [Gemmatimonadales bacterium]|nr:hypothetical protein [Gemmatimonadales bacterium]